MRKRLALSNGPCVVAPNRSARGARLVFVACLGAAAIIVPTTESVLSAKAAAAAIPTCSNPEVREVITTSQGSYGPGTLVVMRSSVRNMSSALCSVAIGPTSPTLFVTNSKGAMVWNNCYVNNRPGTCAAYLTAHTLDPGATYSKTFAWNQRAKLATAGVPAGVYQLTARFSGIAGAHVTKFRLTGSISTQSITVTQADSGRDFSLHVGARLFIQLGGPAIYTWSEPTSTNATVLERTEGSSGDIATATFIAKSPGQVRVTAIDSPNCYPQCLPPSRLFVLTISVVR